VSTARRWAVRVGDGATVAEIVARAGGDPGAVGEGRVFVGRRRVQDANEAVAPGDELSIAPPAAHAEDGEVAILAREDDLLAVLKPAGIPTIADHGGAAHALVARAARLAGVDEARLHPTSRLDREVSGVVLFALSTEAAQRLQRARETGGYARRYVAIASRAPEPARGAWTAPIGRGKSARHRAVNGRDAALAQTMYAAVARAPSGATLLAVSPLTGRTHQIRVHASHAGAPLLGDRAYGGPARLTLVGGRVLELPRIALHAARVTVPRARGAALVVSAPIPDALRAAWAALEGDASAWDAALDHVLDGA
jgi:23S rRNA pseudouridine1911/1915/1917 synthase